MELETKVLSRQIQEALYNNNESLCTAESCTGGRIAEAIIAVPGASQYFKGSIVAYTNEVKESELIYIPTKSILFFQNGIDFFLLFHLKLGLPV